MLIPFDFMYIKYGLNNKKKILHIGAHLCEEKTLYEQQGYSVENVFWIEGNKQLVENIKNKDPNINIYQGVVSDIDNGEVSFIYTNNGQSSSIFELDQHLTEHPYVWETHREIVKTITVDTLLKNNSIDPSDIEFVNIDIQGAELLCMKGMQTVLDHAKYIYTEVNIKHLYKNCALLNEIDSYLEKKGFRRAEISMSEHGWGDALYIRN